MKGRIMDLEGGTMKPVKEGIEVVLPGGFVGVGSTPESALHSAAAHKYSGRKEEPEKIWPNPRLDPQGYIKIK